MQPAETKLEREDQRREILSRGGLADFLRQEARLLPNVPRPAFENLVADIVIRYQNAVGFAENQWRDMPRARRVRHGEVVTKVLAIQDLPEDGRLGWERTVAWSKNKAKVEAQLRRYRSHALTELILSLAATLRFLSATGKTDLVDTYTTIGHILEKAGVPPAPRLRHRKSEDTWYVDTLYGRVMRAGRTAKLEEIGNALMTTDPILQAFRTGRKPPEPLVQAQGRYYRGLP